MKMMKMMKMKKAPMAMASKNMMMMQGSSKWNDDDDEGQNPWINFYSRLESSPLSVNLKLSHFPILQKFFKHFRI